MYYITFKLYDCVELEQEHNHTIEVRSKLKNEYYFIKDKDEVILCIDKLLDDDFIFKYIKTSYKAILQVNRIDTHLFNGFTPIYTIVERDRPLLLSNFVEKKYLDTSKFPGSNYTIRDVLTKILNEDTK